MATARASSAWGMQQACACRDKGNQHQKPTLGLQLGPNLNLTRKRVRHTTEAIKTDPKLKTLWYTRFVC